MEATLAEKLAALAEILWQEVPCDPAKVKAVKATLLRAFKRQSLLCGCGTDHELWIMAFIEIAAMAKEAAAENQGLVQ